MQRFGLMASPLVNGFCNDKRMLAAPPILSPSGTLPKSAGKVMSESKVTLRLSTDFVTDKRMEADACRPTHPFPFGYSS